MQVSCRTTSIAKDRKSEATQIPNLTYFSGTTDKSISDTCLHLVPPLQRIRRILGELVRSEVTLLHMYLLVKTFHESTKALDSNEQKTSNTSQMGMLTILTTSQKRAEQIPHKDSLNTSNQHHQHQQPPDIRRYHSTRNSLHTETNLKAYQDKTSHPPLRPCPHPQPSPPHSSP